MEWLGKINPFSFLDFSKNDISTLEMLMLGLIIGGLYLFAVKYFWQIFIAPENQENKKQKWIIFSLIVILPVLLTSLFIFNAQSSHPNLSGEQKEIVINDGFVYQRYFNKNDNVLIGSDKPFKLAFRNKNKKSEIIDVAKKSRAGEYNRITNIFSLGGYSVSQQDYLKKHTGRTSQSSYVIEYLYNGKPLLEGEVILYVSTPNQFIYDEKGKIITDISLERQFSVWQGDEIIVNSEDLIEYTLGSKKGTIEGKEKKLSLYHADGFMQNLAITGNGQINQKVIISGLNSWLYREKLSNVISNFLSGMLISLGLFIGWIYLFGVKPNVYKKGKKAKILSKEVHMKKVNYEIEELEKKTENLIDSLVNNGMVEATQRTTLLDSWRFKKESERIVDNIEARNKVLKSIGDTIANLKTIAVNKQDLEKMNIKQETLGKIADLDAELEIIQKETAILAEKEKQEKLKKSMKDLLKPEKQAPKKLSKEEIDNIKLKSKQERLKMLDERHDELLKKAKDGLIDKDDIPYLLEDRKRELGLLDINI